MTKLEEAVSRAALAMSRDARLKLLDVLLRDLNKPVHMPSNSSETQGKSGCYQPGVNDANDQRANPS
jgi:hypothetical protein